MERCCLKLLFSSTFMVTSLEEIGIVGHHLYCKCMTNISRCFSVFCTVTKNAIASFFSILQKKAWHKSLRHAPIKENLIVKIEISDSNSYSGTNLFLVLRILRVEVGPTAHPVVAAIEGSDVSYGVETGPAGETCGTEQWASCYRSIAICTNQ